MKVTALPTPDGEGVALAALGVHAVIVAPLNGVPIGQVKVKPVMVDPSLLIKMSVFPEREV